MNIATIAHILVVDDDLRLRKLIARYLGEHGLMVTCACDADDARAKLRFFKYDAIVLDVMMPRETGLQFLQSLFNMGNDTKQLPPVLMLTAMGEAHDRITGLEAGADDYLPKPFEPKELVLRLQKLIKRTQITVHKNMVIMFGDYHLNCEKKLLNYAGKAVHLTEGEMILLLLLAKNLNQPMAREDILQHISGDIDDGNSRMVDVLITRLRKKIEPDPARPLHLITIRGEGYMLRS